MIPRRKPRFYKGELKDILRSILSGKFLDGEHIERFRKEFADYIGTGYAIPACSGRNAMELILEGLNLNKGDEIILPAYTLKDLVRLIQEKGLVVRLADIEEDTFNVDPAAIEKKITERTKVVMVTHLFGLPCNIEEITGIAERHNVDVIEDCTHALGAVYKGKRVGSFGRAGFFSFEATKPVNTFGGGMVVTNDGGIASTAESVVKGYPFDRGSVLTKTGYAYLERLMVATQLFSLLNLCFVFGFTGKILSKLYLFLHSRARARYTRFTNLQAFLGIRQLSDLDERNEGRNRTALKLTERLNSDPDTGFLPQGYGEGRIFYFYVIRAVIRGELERIRKRMLLRGVDVGIKEEITDDCSLIADGVDHYPVVKNVFGSAVQLPVYDGLRDKDLDFIVKALKRSLK
ncbi:MAG: hypothetical protein DRP85_04290 [Candidatus Makaraimicrobium thalassicum]|nr:MAG: hypothetical protein DRP85_04290 [Candidatus Omnitrophota bacterium]